VATLRRTHALLDAGGHCLLRVPTVSSWAWRHYGVDWVQLDAPRHLYLFARESITHLAAATGFELVDGAMTRTPSSPGAAAYRRGIPLRDAVNRRRALQPPRHRLVAPCRQLNRRGVTRPAAPAP
jgi:hypothetical protein